MEPSDAQTRSTQKVVSIDPIRPQDIPSGTDGRVMGIVRIRDESGIEINMQTIMRNHPQSDRGKDRLSMSNTLYVFASPGNLYKPVIQVLEAEGYKVLINKRPIPLHLR